MLAVLPLTIKSITMTVFGIYENYQNYDDFGYWVSDSLIGIYESAELASKAIEERCNDIADSIYNGIILTKKEKANIAEAQDARSNKKLLMDSRFEHLYEYFPIYEVKEIHLNKMYFFRD
jgi:hypothetical protein